MISAENQNFNSYKMPLNRAGCEMSIHCQALKQELYLNTSLSHHVNSEKIEITSVLFFKIPH